MKTLIEFRAEEEDLEGLKNLAEAQGKPYSEVLREAIRRCTEQPKLFAQTVAHLLAGTGEEQHEEN